MNNTVEHCKSGVARKKFCSWVRKTKKLQIIEKHLSEKPQQERFIFLFAGETQTNKNFNWKKSFCAVEKKHNAVCPFSQLRTVTACAMLSFIAGFETQISFSS